MPKIFSVTSPSQLKKNKTFSLKIFKEPFCFKEKKKYKIYEMPKFKTAFFKSLKVKDLSNKCIFISGPARSGNHLLLSMLDNHPEINFEVVPIICITPFAPEYEFAFGLNLLS